MTDRYDELRAAAEAATPGPWGADGRDVRATLRGGLSVAVMCSGDRAGSGGSFTISRDEVPLNAAFIALANSETIKALFSERDSLLNEAREAAELDALTRAQLTMVQDENERLLAALKEAESVFALVERPAFVDPQHGETVRQLGERIGYGALMASASASWREKLSNHRPGGEFVAGPCHSTVIATLKTIRAALTTTEG